VSSVVHRNADVYRTLWMDADTSDEELMRQFAAGRPEALGPLHARYALLI